MGISRHARRAHLPKPPGGRLWRDLIIARPGEENAPTVAGASLPLEGTPVSLPLGGFAVLNDTPVACQTRGPTDPQGDRWRAAPDEVTAQRRKIPISPHKNTDNAFTE